MILFSLEAKFWLHNTAGYSSVVYFTGIRRMNSTQLYEWLINEGIDEEGAKIVRGMILLWIQ